MKYLDVFWAGVVWGVLGCLYSLCLMAVYETKRPHQGTLSENEEKAMNQTMTRICIAAGAIIAACAMFLKAITH